MAVSEESSFANTIAHYLGYDPRTVYAWAQLETGGQAIGHNWLNLRPYHPNGGGKTDDVGVVGISPGGFDIFESVSAAAISTEHRLHQPFAAGIRSASGPGHSPAQEIAALAASDWDEGHYGGTGGPSIANVFSGLYGQDALGAPASSHVVKDAGKQTSSSVIDKLTGVPGSGGIGGIGGDVASFLKTWVVRGALIGLGTGVVLIGLYFIVRALGAPTIAPMETATRFVTRGRVAAKSSRDADDKALVRTVRRQEAADARAAAKAAKGAERDKRAQMEGYGDVPF
jgi:hypothetical protein